MAKKRKAIVERFVIVRRGLFGGDIDLPYRATEKSCWPGYPLEAEAQEVADKLNRINDIAPFIGSEGTADYPFAVKLRRFHTVVKA